MTDADKKMPEDFYEWLDQCPVMWHRLAVDENDIEYVFTVPYELQDDDTPKE